MKTSYMFSNGDWADAVIILEPTTGQPIESGSHSYGYDTSGNMITDTWTTAAGVYVKTFTWTNGAITGKSDWVKQ